MKHHLLSRKLLVLFGILIILLFSSCKLTDAIRDKLGGVLDKGSDTPQQTQVAAGEDDSQIDNIEDDGELSMDPIEDVVDSTQLAWTPELESVITKTLQTGESQLIEVDSTTQLLFPPDTFTEQPPDLVVSYVTNDFPTTILDYQFMDGIDISLGDMHHLNAPLQVTMKFDPGKLDGELPAAIQIGAALYDDMSDSWIILPSEIDEDENSITFQTDHLSVVALYLHRLNDSACETDHFTIGYNKDNINKAAGNMNYNSNMSSCKTSGHPALINAVADYLETSYSGYTAAGFPFSEKTIAVNVADLSDSYVFGSESQFDSLTGELVIGTMSWGYPDDLRQDCAHELFHYWQYNSTGTYTYMTNGWWMDATADFAADQVAYAGSNFGETNAMGQDIKDDYLNDSLNSTKNMHAYSSAHFVDYVVNNSGGYPTFHDLWVTSVASTSAIDDLKTSFTEHLYSPYADVYRDFANYMLFDSNSALPLGDGIWDTKAIKDKVVYSAEDGENSALAYVKPYASIVYGLRVDDPQFMYLEWTNQTEGVTYVFFDTDDDQRTGIKFWKQLFATKKAIFPMEPEETIYILMINPTSSELKFDLKYGASVVSVYTVNYRFGGSDECVENSNWGSPQIFMDMNNGQASLHYDSKSDDYYWYSGAEHTIVASGQGSYDTKTLQGWSSSTDTIHLGIDKDGEVVIGTISVDASFNLEADPDMPFVWRGTASGSSAVNLPETTNFAGYVCSGTVTGVSVYASDYFPLPR